MKYFQSNPGLLVRRLGLMLMDSVLVAAAMAIALWVRFDMQFLNISPEYWNVVSVYWPINIVCTLIIFAFARMYRSLWRFASVEELKYLVLGCLGSGAAQMIGMLALHYHMPRSYPIMYTVVLLGLMTVSRFSYRLARIGIHNMENRIAGQERRKTMVVGAGAAGFMIVREIRNSKHLNRELCCLIDDSPQKIGTYLQGVPVVGDKSTIPHYAKQYHIQDIFIAIPTLSPESRKELLEICQETGCHVLILPGIYQLVDQEVKVSMLREVQIDDLLGREPVSMDRHDILRCIRGKTILVTGGGGSIGSEICRQVAAADPARLIIFDIYENNAYEIQQELRSKYPQLALEVLIGSVRDADRVDSIFEQWRPDLVFHAAAHKHVPLMEDSPHEAIKNNALGTWNVASAADRYGASKMVLISTDKAVRPTNIMGASKRVCELVVQYHSQRSKTDYAAVRFGNVLGSNGSVIPLFRRQIAEGGPVTVTHPDIIRYFMTIPEAVNLVLQCGALAKGGELFILDMGKPVKIYDLAKNMIRLSGYTPDVDISIVFTGLRPGEKLYEELLIREDNLLKTEKDRIFVARQIHVDEPEFEKDFRELILAAYAEEEDIRPALKKLVPEYRERSQKEQEQAREVSDGGAGQ